MKIKIPAKELQALSPKLLLETINNLISEMREQYSLAHDGESMTKEQILRVLNGENSRGWGPDDLNGNQLESKCRRCGGAITGACRRDEC